MFGSAVAIGDVDFEPALQRRKHHEYIGDAVALVFVIMSGDLSLFGRDQRAVSARRRARQKAGTAVPTGSVSLRFSYVVAPPQTTWLRPDFIGLAAAVFGAREGLRPGRGDRPACLRGGPPKLVRRPDGAGGSVPEPVRR